MNSTHHLAGVDREITTASDSLAAGAPTDPTGSASVTVRLVCGGAAHQITISEDRAGRARVTLHHHDRRAENVLAALAGKPSPCLAAAAALRALRAVEAAPLERARWIATGVRTPADLVAWRALAATPEDTRRWIALGITQACRATYWVNAQYDLEDLEAWAAAGVAPGHTVDCWGRLGVTRPDDRQPWIDAGVTGPDDAKSWAFPLDVDHPRHVRAWLDAGAADGGDYSNWRIATLNQPGEIAAWQRAGVRSGHEAVDWVYANVRSPAKVRTWIDSGVTGPAEVKGWAVAGVSSPEQLAAWHAIGIHSGVHAATWIKPQLVTGIDEIRAWKQAGVSDPDQARQLTQLGRVPASVFTVQLDGLARILRSRPERDGRAGWILPAEGGGIIEVYFYAYGRVCGPEVATHWTSVHVRDGNEIPRSRQYGVAPCDLPQRMASISAPQGHWPGAPSGIEEQEL